MAKSASPNAPGYWLVKTEPDCFSIQDLAKSRRQTTFWHGVRNYQARNFMRDDMRLGDKVLVYHSSTNPPAVVGVATVSKPAYPDHTALDPKSDYHDPKATSENPIWYMVDITLVEVLPRPLGLDELRGMPSLKNMELLRRGSRLSVQPVSQAEFDAILSLAHGAFTNTSKSSARKPIGSQSVAAKKPTVARRKVAR